MELKYLPVKTLYVSKPSIYSFRFEEPISPHRLGSENSNDVIHNALRKLSLRVQRHYRKEIKESGLSFDDFVLGIYEGFTILSSGYHDYALFCRLILIPMKEIGQWTNLPKNQKE